jgi:hypothetical protein
MIVAVKSGPTVIWLLLMLATLAGVGTARSGGWGFALVMLAATLKAHLIVRHYMDLRAAPLAWRLVFDGLVVAGGGIITCLHFLA